MEEAAGVLSTMGLRLSPEKTLINHIDEGLDFLGWHIQRHRKRGTNKYYVYTYPSRKALVAVMGKFKTQCRKTGTDLPFDTLLINLNRMLRGWCAYFRPGVSSATFRYLASYVWGRVIWWLRRKHPRMNWKDLRRRFCGGRWWPASEERELFNPAKVGTTRYRYRISHPLPMAERGAAGAPSLGRAADPRRVGDGRIERALRPAGAHVQPAQPPAWPGSPRSAPTPRCCWTRSATGSATRDRSRRRRCADCCSSTS